MSSIPSISKQGNWHTYSSVTSTSKSSDHFRHTSKQVSLDIQVSQLSQLRQLCRQGFQPIMTQRQPRQSRDSIEGIPSQLVELTQFHWQSHHVPLWQVEWSGLVPRHVILSQYTQIQWIHLHLVCNETGKTRVWKYPHQRTMFILYIIDVIVVMD